MVPTVAIPSAIAIRAAGERRPHHATARTHKVRRGETLTGIARRYRVSLTALKRANSIRNEHALMAGTRMLLLDEPFEGLAPALARRLGEVMANLKGQRLSILIAESNEVHIADLLSRAFRIERGAVAPV